MEWGTNGVTHTGQKAAAVILTLMFLLTGLSSAAQGQDQLPEGTYLDATNPDAVAPFRNLLVIDALTGGRVSFDNSGANLTDLRIVNVEPGLTSIALFEPGLLKVYSNASSTSGGYIDFPLQTLKKGVYTVKQEFPWYDVVIAVFSTDDIALQGTSTSNAGSGGGGGSSSSIPPDCPWPGYVMHRRVVARQILWLPDMISTSPYQGSASASAWLGNLQSTYVFPYGHATTLTRGSAFSPSWGDTWGSFQLVEVEKLNETVTDGRCGSTFRHTARIGDLEPLGYARTHAMYIGGPNNRTDADKQTSIQMDGNGSALFDARYRGRHHELTAYGAEYTLVTGQNTRRVFAIGASVGFGSHGSVGAEVFRVETSSDSGWAYTYTFSPSGKWYITNVGPGLRSFCMTNRTWCDP